MKPVTPDPKPKDKKGEATKSPAKPPKRTMPKETGKVFPGSF